MTRAEVVPYETGVRAIDRTVEYWGRASLLPKQYRLPADEGGGPNYPNLVIAAQVLHVLDVEPFPNLPATYVVGGAVGLMAALQIALAQRDHAFPVIDYSDDKRASARLLHGASWGCPWCARPDYEGHRAEVTIAEATRAGWTKRNPNYSTMPRQMLEARAITDVLRHNAPGVLRGIASRAATVARLDEDEGEQSAPAIPQPPPVGMEIAGAGYPLGQSHAPPPRKSTDDLALELHDNLAALDGRDPDLAAELLAEYEGLMGQLTDHEGRTVELPRRLVVRYMLDEYRSTFEAASGVVDPTADDAPRYGTSADPDAGDEPTGGDDPGRAF
jgi:hypothetical protein